MNESINNSVKRQQRPQAPVPMIDLKQIIALVCINKRLIIGSMIAFVLIAGVYLWITPTKVSVVGKMEIIDKSSKNSGVSAGLAMLNSLPMGLGSSISGNLGGSLGIDSEREILMSTTLVRDVVRDLGLYTEYRLCSWGRQKLLYKDQPINVALDRAHVKWLDEELPLTNHQIKLDIEKDNNGYTVNVTLKENKEKKKLPKQTFVSLPATIKTDAGTVTLTENVSLLPRQREAYEDGYRLKVNIIPPTKTVDKFLGDLQIAPPSKKVTNILNITLSDESVLRGIDFVNHLVDAYNKRANEDKNEEARKTDEFVNARLAKLDAELGSSDSDWEKYKKQFQITVPEVDAEEVMTKKSMYETQLVEIGTQLQLHDYLNEYINDPDNLYEIIPLAASTSSLTAKGGEHSGAVTQSASFIAQHNELVNQRRDFLKSMSEKAPQVERLTESIKELHPVIKTAMKRDRQSILLKRSNVEREYGKYMGRVGSAPQQERVLTEIGRQREIKQGVYLLMLQKREETAMELANVNDKGKLIDETHFIEGSYKPKKKMVLLGFLFFSPFIPLVVLLLIKVLRNRIDNEDEIEKVFKNSVLGSIPNVTYDEAIRIVRNNLQLSLNSGNTILVVSDSENDGKTFVSKQLADSFSQLGKKTLFLNLNLRASASDIASYLPELKNLHPADLLARDEFAQLMTQLKSQYDYIVIDTPALGKYADAYQIGRFADLTCYVVKAGQTSKSAVEKLKKETRLSNVKFVINSVDMTKKKYQYYYKNVLSFVAAALLFSACGSSGKIAYIQNADNVDFGKSKVLFDARIMPKDILTVTVSTIDPEASIPFNLTVSSTTANTNLKSLTTQPALQDYLVSNDGTIEFPIIGQIKVVGLTKTECEAMILEKIRPYMADSEKPIVTVRMSSYSIAVLGEVKNPGSFQVTREKINIFEALAQAGDMTIYGVRDRVRLIREDASGKKEIQVLDLTDANIINSPYYYLQQNDIIYVEPSKVKKQDARVGSMTNLWFSATSILVSVASLLVNILR